MFLLLKIITLMLLSTLISSCGGGGDGGAAPPAWTVLVYMDGDNNLDRAALQDLAEMRVVGSSAQVNVVVQLDLTDKITTKRYRVRKNAVDLIADLGELDMASPKTLTDFLVWGKTTYPAQRTLVILWNHGNGWDQMDGPSGPVCANTGRSLFYDDDNNSRFLSNRCVKQAIQNADIKIDLLGLDASIMGTIEALYEFKDLSDIIVSSQEVGESNGWDYQAILQGLTERPTMQAEELATRIVDAYRAFFEDYFYPLTPNYEQRHTITALRSSELQALAEGVDNVARSFIARLSDPSTRGETLTLIRTARAQVQEIDFYTQPKAYVDLVDLDRLLGQPMGAAELMAKATIAEYRGAARPNAHGLSIVFFKLPEAKTFGTFDQNYQNYDQATNIGNSGGFINQYQWDEFLRAYDSADALL